MSFELKNITPPPSSRMPTSKETRVRVEDFENISDQVCPFRGWSTLCPRVFFTSLDSRKMCSMSSRGSFSILRRCFMALGGEFSRDIANDFDSFVGFAFLEIQCGQKTNHLRPCGHRQQARVMQCVYKLNRWCFVALGKSGNVLLEF